MARPRRRRGPTTRLRATSSFTSIASSNPKARVASRPERKMFKSIGRLQFVQEAVGLLLAAYLRLVQRTTRFLCEPADLEAALGARSPLIAAMWHGQHLMMTFAWPAAIERLAALISRHEDAGAQAAALRQLGVTPVRGSGGPADRATTRAARRRCASLLRQLEIGAVGGDDRRRAQARPRLRPRHRHSGEAVRPADRADRGGDEPAHPVQLLGPRLARPAVQPRRASSSATSCACRPTPTTRRWRRRASPCSRASTTSTPAPTRWSARRDPGAHLRTA